MPCACSESSLLIKSLCFGDNRHKYFRFLLVFLFLFFAFVSLAWYAGEQHRTSARPVTSTPASLRKLFLFPIWSAIQKRLSNRIFFKKTHCLKPKVTKDIVNMDAFVRSLFSNAVTGFLPCLALSSQPWKMYGSGYLPEAKADLNLSSNPKPCSLPHAVGSQQQFWAQLHHAKENVDCHYSKDSNTCRCVNGVPHFFRYFRSASDTKQMASQTVFTFYCDESIYFLFLFFSLYPGENCIRFDPNPKYFSHTFGAWTENQKKQSKTKPNEWSAVGSASGMLSCLSAQAAKL